MNGTYTQLAQVMLDPVQRDTAASRVVLRHIVLLAELQLLAEMVRRTNPAWGLWPAFWALLATQLYMASEAFGESILDSRRAKARTRDSYRELANYLMAVNSWAERVEEEFGHGGIDTGSVPAPALNALPPHAYRLEPSLTNWRINLGHFQDALDAMRAAPPRPVATVHDNDEARQRLGEALANLSRASLDVRERIASELKRR